MERTSWFILAVTTLCIHQSGQAAVDLETPSTAPTPVKTELNRNMADAVNTFGYKLLLKMMNERKQENIVISPTGIAGLLAMTLLGSVGTTYDEIAEVLGFSQDLLANRRDHHVLGALLQALNSNVSSKTLYADAMFVDAQAPLRELYRNYLHEVYRGEVLETDFKRSNDAKNLINEWVKNNTQGQIENFLDQPLPMTTKVVLLSALYFRGQWEHPFLPEYTAKMSFKKEMGDVSMVDLMFAFHRYPYTFSEKHDFYMIALPYNDSETFMYALKPRLPNKTNLLTLMEQIDYETIDKTINELKTRKCMVRFPKMEVKSGVNLANTLKALGIREMFKPGKANFALMIQGDNKIEDEIRSRARNENEQSVKNMIDGLPNPGIYVDSVIHEVKMSINEYGTEAVAATSAVLARSADLFYADSPFYVFIRNNRTKLVTFSAVIYDPKI